MSQARYKVGPPTDYMYEAEVLKIVDGDTYDFRIHWERDIGFKITVKQEHEIRTRAYGINTPEIKGESRPAGLKAVQFVQEWLLLYATDNYVVVKTYKADSLDKYGRYLAEVWSADMARCLNRDLLETGNAVAYFP